MSALRLPPPDWLLPVDLDEEDEEDDQEAGAREPGAADAATTAARSAFADAHLESDGRAPLLRDLASTTAAHDDRHATAEELLDTADDPPDAPLTSLPAAARRRVISRELLAWAAFAGPRAATVLSRAVVTLQDLVFLAHWDATYLGAAGVATTFASITSVVVWRGVLDAINPLCARAVAAGKPALAGEWLRIGLMLSTALSLPIAALWMRAGSLMRPVALLDAVEEDRVNLFCTVLIIGELPLFWYAALSNFLGALGILRPAVLVNVSTLLFNLGFNAVLVHRLGFLGSALASSLTRVVVFLGVWIWMLVRVWAEPTSTLARSYPGPLSWCRRGAPSRSHVRRFIGLAVPYSVAALLEEAQVQAIAVMAARLGDAEMAAHNSIMQLVFVLCALLWAASHATQVRIAHNLSAGRPHRAKVAMNIGVAACLGLGVGVALAFAGLRHYVGLLFSDETLRALVEEISLLVGLSYLLLACCYCAVAVLSAQARSGAIAVSFFVGAWGVGVPLAAVLAFREGRGLVGLWTGVALGYLVAAVVALVAVARTDWEAAVREAKARSSRALFTSVRWGASGVWGSE